MVPFFLMATFMSSMFCADSIRLLFFRSHQNLKTFLWPFIIIAPFGILAQRISVPLESRICRKTSEFIGIGMKPEVARLDLMRRKLCDGFRGLRLLFRSVDTNA